MIIKIPNICVTHYDDNDDVDNDNDNDNEKLNYITMIFKNLDDSICTIFRIILSSCHIAFNCLFDVMLL